MGILRADKITGLGGANAIKGSVEFRARQNMRAEVVNGNADFNLGSGDFTLECWWNSGGDLSTDIDFVTLWNWSGNRQAWGMYYDADTGVLGFIGDTTGSGGGNISYTQAAGFEKNKWYHLAIVRISNTLTLYKNGTSIGSNSSYTSTIYENTVDPLVIGGQLDGTNYDSKIMRGFISNLRIIKGEGIYTGNFTPPTNELTVTPNTVLLACQSPGNILQEATGKKLIAYRSTKNDSFAKASTFTPNTPVGFSTTSDVGSQYGLTFDGFGSFATSTYMVPPGGNIRERGRGRALLGGGHNGSSHTNHIHQLSIQSEGNTEEFGDLTNGRWIPAPSSSYTRGVWSGGGGPSPGSPTGSYVNFIDFVTIASSSNATDFGDQTAEKGYHTGLSNETRGITAGGYNDSVGKINPIEYITIATAGNAQDFGDLTVARMQLAAAGSPTRGLFFGGSVSPNVNGNVVDYITIATTGNAQDFGDMTSTTKYGNATSSNTRAIYAGGLAPNDTTYVNTIEYFTIATLGNGTDFGDLTTNRSTTPGATSNNIRGIFAGGYVPGSNLNSIDFVTIATLGNASDFGDISFGLNMRGIGALSDSHGGLS